MAPHRLRALVCLFIQLSAKLGLNGSVLNRPCHKKTCLRVFVNNTGADQPAHPRSLISAFVIRF